MSFPSPQRPPTSRARRTILAARTVHHDVLVDRQSVEGFFDAGHTVPAQQESAEPSDTRISFDTDGGSATSSGITLSRL